jgi:hypothetical protein
MKPKTSKRKTSKRKSGGERRKVERRKAPRRLRKTVSVPARRVKKSRRSAARRGGVRRSSDTYFQLMGNWPSKSQNFALFCILRKGPKGGVVDRK